MLGEGGRCWGRKEDAEEGMKMSWDVRGLDV